MINCPHCGQIFQGMPLVSIRCPYCEHMIEAPTSNQFLMEFDTIQIGPVLFPEKSETPNLLAELPVEDPGFVEGGPTH